MWPPSLAASLVLSVLEASAPSSPPPAQGKVTVMTYNVLYSAPPEDVAKSLDLIEKEAPDILCLRELTPGFASAFRKRLGKEYPHVRLVPRKGTWGVGIASRHPMTRTEHFSQEPHRMPALEADVRLAGRTLKVSCVHLMAPGATHRKDDDLVESMAKNAVLRKKQADALMKRYSKEQGPLLLLGDMNEGRAGDAMKAFASADFQHACEGPGESCGSTWPGAASVLPAIVEIDHILGRRITLSDAKVLRNGGSDHDAVRASLEFPP
ncbi:endonuclease/exonuclease/phosphatase family protein [Myxococcus sp. CA051A]|uniref:endonuclease/exonuclease/phosphatase family protein n=1 Tax=Myxococcus sp. CA051A TaxID=2741739 RepID=UPI00157A722B|nr:endonuclease/exonuclease/phosphatase family protein [Myxococcus sp. CA051A]NTX61736.1 endonuclease/exonuclease/phosphatase family protein [Myxococcus sp. CA051A]